MVKVLDNHLIDLDILPGTKPADLFTQASAVEEKNPDKARALRALAEQRAADLMEQVGRKTSGVPLPPEVVPVQQSQGGFVGGVKGVGMGLASTVGALGKGVGDTLGNTVYGLGKGLVDTGTGVVGGLSQTGKSAIGAGHRVEPGTEKIAPEPSVERPAGESDSADSTAMAKSGPRKIEIRSGNVPPIKDTRNLSDVSPDQANLDKLEGLKLVGPEGKPHQET